MLNTRRARVLVVCAMLSLPPAGGALADPQIKPPKRKRPRKHCVSHCTRSRPVPKRSPKLLSVADEVIE